MNNLTPQQITNLKIEIDAIKEYVYSDLCRQCEEMSKRLIECERLLANEETQS
jgi:hypothetical protein